MNDSVPVLFPTFSIVNDTVRSSSGSTTSGASTDTSCISASPLVSLSSVVPTSVVSPAVSPKVASSTVNWITPPSAYCSSTPSNTSVPFFVSLAFTTTLRSVSMMSPPITRSTAVSVAVALPTFSSVYPTSRLSSGGISSGASTDSSSSGSPWPCASVAISPVVFSPTVDDDSVWPPVSPVPTPSSAETNPVSTVSAPAAGISPGVWSAVAGPASAIPSATNTSSATPTPRATDRFVPVILPCLPAQSGESAQ